MQRGQRSDEAVLPHGLQLQPGVTGDTAHERGVQSSVGGLRQPLVRGQAHELDGVAGKASVKLREHARQALAQSGAGPQPHGRRSLGHQVGDRLPSALRAYENRARFWQEALPGDGERHATGRAVQERDAELSLEAAHLLADRRLDDV